jgi:hypothetical protein
MGAPVIGLTENSNCRDLASRSLYAFTARYKRPTTRVQQETRTFLSRCILILSFAPQHWQIETQVTAHFFLLSSLGAFRL